VHPSTEAKAAAPGKGALPSVFARRWRRKTVAGILRPTTNPIGGRPDAARGRAGKTGQR